MGMRNAVDRRQLWWLGFDFLVLCALAAAAVVLNVVPYPNHALLPDDVHQYMYPVRQSHVSDTLLFILAVVVPVVVMAVVLGARRVFRNICPTAFAFMLALITTLILTGALKNMVGRPRPMFYWKCWPEGSVYQPPVPPDYIPQCDPLVPLETIYEAQRSFPSGHSSVSFAGLGFLALFLAANLQVFDQNCRVWKATAAVTPLVGALMIAVSRYMDYHHWPTDIMAGCLLGLICASFSYLFYFPSPFRNLYAQEAEYADLWSPRHLFYGVKANDQIPLWRQDDV